MVGLNDNYLQNSTEFIQKKIALPQYDQDEVVETTKKAPIWVHFGGGNLFRCFHAGIAQQLLNQKQMTSGVIVAETYDDEVIDQMYHPYNNRVLSVTMKSDGTLDKELVASVGASVYFNRNNTKGWNYLTNVFENPTLQFVTFSITEKGYALTDINGALTTMAQEDISAGPEKPITNMGAVAHLLYARYQRNQAPLALVSTDNFSQNGAKLEQAIMTIAQGWKDNQLVDAGFIQYLQDRSKITFPWSMIDRITPNPSEEVAQKLTAAGFDDTQILHTVKHTNIAPFGNTEETHYLVIEDDFPNGRPPLEKAGVLMADRQTVNDTDQMKVTACLNPLHTALAIFGNLLGYQSIAAEIANPTLLGLIKNLGYQEDLPVVKDPKIINPEKFINQLITKRLPNKNIPDTPQRIAADTSQKIPIRYGVTIQHYLDDPKRDVQKLEFIPLILAGWCRYLMGIDDQDQGFTLSPDPMLKDVQPYVKSIKIGSAIDVHKHLQHILSNKKIFGNDLYAINLGTKVEQYFAQMITSKGAVIKTIQQTISEKGNY